MPDDADASHGDAETGGTSHGDAETGGTSHGDAETGDAVDTDADDPLAWDTVDSWTGYDCPGFEIVHDEVRLPDGTRTDYDYLSDVPSVVVLPLTPAGDVVVIEEWRQAVGRVNRGLPAGGTEPGDDDLAAAARRELAEETGYEAESVSHLVTVEPANGIADAVLHYYVAEGCTPAGTQDLDHDESIRVGTTGYDDLRAAVLDGQVRDGRTVTGVCYYELQRDLNCK